MQLMLFLPLIAEIREKKKDAIYPSFFKIFVKFEQSKRRDREWKRFGKNL
jgi:hypothetical protein